MTKQEFMTELAMALNESPTSVASGVSLESLTGWDSVGVLGVMAMMEGSLGVQVEPDALRGCQTVDDLVKLAGDKVE